jgi:hypothetical protein
MRNASSPGSAPIARLLSTRHTERIVAGLGPIARLLSTRHTERIVAGLR